MNDTQSEIDLSTLNEAINELVDRQRENHPYGEELLVAGRFLAKFGPLGDLFDEPALSTIQFAGAGNSALSMLGHHSVERGDPNPDPSDPFEHSRNCQVCDYLEGVLDLRMAFEYELCHECGLDLDAHDIAPDPL